MAHYDFDMGILGAGAAGLTVAAGAAQVGAKVLLVEKSDRLGGDCLYYGCVPSKTLIKTAQVYHLMREAGRFGLPVVQVPRPIYSEIAARIQSVIAAIQQHDSPERFCALGVMVEYGPSTFVDDHSILLNGKRLSAKYWVIATGSSAAAPPIPGLAETGFITNREIYSLDRLPASMVIIGGGPIGVEFAQAFSRLGTRVAVVESFGQILNNDDRDMADMVMDVLRGEGVEFFLDSAVTAVGSHGVEKEVTFTQGTQTRTVRGEVLLVATGRKANLEDIGLEAAGVERDKKGLRLDDRLRTTQKHIFGAGDVTGTYQFTHAAGYEGTIVLTNAMFHLPRKARYAYMPWVTYADPELASIGMNEKSARAAGVDYRVWSEEFSRNDRSLAEGQTTGKIKVLLDDKGHPIGVQILGPEAGDLLAEWVTVMNGRVKLSTLASAVHPYPTLGEINKRVAANFLATKVFSENMREMLTFFFGLKGRACSQDNSRPDASDRL
jgi:pyruvate/2-oxoglutarate dehydrogenase complex dihydrolipoamide dehydrogenase (E3) component